MGRKGWMVYARYLMEKHLGRKLKHTEIVHHDDDNSLNDDISNLVLVDKATHTLIHFKGKKTGPLRLETRRKMSESKKGCIFSDEHRKNLSIASTRRWERRRCGHAKTIVI
jgi:hypothetical protein